MCKNLLILICLAVLLIGSQVLSQTAPDPQPDYYKAGLVHLDAGDWLAAVKSWVSAGQILQRQQKADPRIGISFIELVTEQKAVKYYELACEMYLWGFSHGGAQNYNKDISVVPPGHSTSSRSTEVSSPRPKWVLWSLLERKL